jgi:hypothetical protein
VRLPSANSSGILPNAGAADHHGCAKGKDGGGVDEAHMQHLQMGKESMSQCPMMKGMKGMDEQSTGAHKAHQEEQK